MHKPISNLTFIIISILFILLGTAFLYLDYQKLELKKDEIKCMKMSSIEKRENNESNIFNSLYIKTKGLFN